jgi:D-arabinose 5-phosphate isomerase GutQ
MTQNLTDWLQQSRFVVVEVDRKAGRLRVRGADDACTDLSCREPALVVTDEGVTHDLDALNPGDIVKIESAAGRADRIVVLRRAWEEWASPEL